MKNEQTINEIAAQGHINLSIFVDAGRWIYSDPEATAQRYKDGHEMLMINDTKKILAFSDDKELANKLALEYVQGYKIRYEKKLFADSRCASSFITGGSNFPVARMQKRNNIAQKRNDELIDWCDWKMKKIRNTLQPTIIKSDDEKAIIKLETKVAKLEKLQVFMKSANKVIKKWNKTSNIGNMEDVRVLNAELKAIGLDDKFIKEAVTPNFMGRIGFASYALTNNNATIRNTKKRLEKLKEDAAMAAKVESGEVAAKEYLFSDGKVLYNYEAQRVQIIFDNIPSPVIRTALKKISCRWSPKNSAWQMHLKEWNYRAAVNTIKELYEKEGV